MIRNYEQTSTVQCRRASFTWKLKNFPSAFFMSGFIESSEFHCSNTSWCLRIYPIHRYQEEKGIKLSLYRISNPFEEAIWYRIGFKNKDGKDFNAKTKRLKFSEQPKHPRLILPSDVLRKRIRDDASDYALLPKDILQEKFQDLLPDRILTVFCELRITSVIHDNITAQIPRLGAETSTAIAQIPSEHAKPLDANLQVGKECSREDMSASGGILHSAKWEMVMVWWFMIAIIFVLAYLYEEYLA